MRGLYAVRPRTILHRFIIAYPANVPNRTSFDKQPIETITKSLVRFNATNEATVANGRFRDAAPSQIVRIEPDQGRGEIVSLHNVIGRNLEEVLEDLTEMEGSAFGLAELEDDSLEFRYLPVEQTAI